MPTLKPLTVLTFEEETKEVCSNSTTLLGNDLNGVQGVWIVLSGTALLETPHNILSEVSNLSLGENAFAWTSRNENCESLSFTYKVIYRPISLNSLPNIITPNGDGKNDFLEITDIDLYPDNTITITNRWGKNCI